MYLFAIYIHIPTIGLPIWLQKTCPLSLFNGCRIFYFKRAILSSSKILTPHPPLPLASLSSPRNKGGGTHSPGGEGDGGSIFWKTRKLGLPSHSNGLSTVAEQQQRVRGSRGQLGRLCESVLVSLDHHSVNHTRQNLR
jgi:hypothetical protein